MGRINWGRVFLGGLLAGVVVNVSESLLNAVVVKKQAVFAIAPLRSPIGRAASGKNSSAVSTTQWTGLPRESCT